MMRSTVLLVSLLAFVVAPQALGGAGQGQTVIVVVGAPGTPEYAKSFAQWVETWQGACTASDVDFQAIGRDGNNGTTDREQLKQALAEQTRQTPTTLWLVLVGHGTFDGRTAKFNLRGPDISADDVAAWLEPLSCPVAVINAASSSAPFLKTLSGPQRVIITATKSGFEQNYARFGGFLADAIIDPAADLDKDGQTSLLEAFLTASHRVAEFYAAAGRLATEHALLDDNGDALGTPADWFRGIRPIQSAADGATLDGYRAHQFHLQLSEAEARIPPALRAERNRLELEVMELRGAKDQMSKGTYYARLETLLYRIARIYEQIDDPNGRP